MRILHLEDDFLIQELVKISLDRDPDLQLVTFSHGAAALDYLRVNTVDLIISDVMLPTMSGPAFAKAVQDEQLSSAPLVFLTSAYDVAAAELLVCRPAAIWPKPFNALTLAQRVRALCEPTADAERAAA